MAPGVRSAAAASLCRHNPSRWGRRSTTRRGGAGTGPAARRRHRGRAVRPGRM